MAKEIKLEDFMEKLEVNLQNVHSQQPYADFSDNEVRIRSRQIKALAITVVETLNEMNKEEDNELPENY